MKLRFANNGTQYHGGFTRPGARTTYFALDITQVQMWYLNYADELHIFLQGRKKGLVLTKNSPELGGEANFNNLVLFLGVEFEDAQIVTNRLEHSYSSPDDVENPTPPIA